MSYRRRSPPLPRDGSHGQSSSHGYREDYRDRRGPPPPPRSREYRDEYDSRRPRRSVSPIHSRSGGYSSRNYRDDRQPSRRDRDAPPPPRLERSNRHEGPPQPREEGGGRDGNYSPLRRANGQDRRGDVQGRQRQVDEYGERGPAEPNETTKSARSVKMDGSGAPEEEEDGEVDNNAEAEMMRAMGFGGFGTTKNSKVEGNQTGAAEVKKERTWRQYMQRKGGFNRPLSPVRKG